MSIKTRYILTLLIFSIIWVASARSALADTVTFDFEDQPDAPLASGTLTSVVLTQSGLSVSIRRESRARFDIVDLSPFASQGTPTSWGSRTLDPFFNLGASAFIATFSQPVSAVSIEVGDYGQDADDLLLQAFGGGDATGALLGSDTGSLPAGGGFTLDILSVSALGINSIRFIGGNPEGPHSVFYDNLVVTFTPTQQPIPEPTTMLLCSAPDWLA